MRVQWQVGQFQLEWFLLLSLRFLRRLAGKFALFPQMPVLPRMSPRKMAELTQFLVLTRPTRRTLR